MKIEELSQLIVTKDEKLFGKISEKRAKRIVRATINAIGEQLDEKKEGKISIQGFGTFRKKTIEKEGISTEKIIFKRHKKKSKIKK